MDYRTLARSPLKVSRLGLGTVQFGMDYGFTKAKVQREVDEMLERSAEAGLNFLDTAPSYGDSEAKIGDYLRRRRDAGFVIATKIERIPRGMPGGRIVRRILDSLRGSLKRLGRERIEVLLLHQADRWLIDDDGFWDALRAARESGLFELFGVSVYEPAEAEELLRARAEDVRLLQVPYSVFDQRFASIFAAARRAEVSLIGRSAFLRGAITAEDGSLPGHLGGLAPARRRLAEIGRRVGLAVSDLALLFAVSEEAFHSTILGVDSAGELGRNVGALSDLGLLKAVKTELRSLGVSDPDLVDPRRWGMVEHG